MSARLVELAVQRDLVREAGLQAVPGAQEAKHGAWTAIAAAASDHPATDSAEAMIAADFRHMSTPR